MMPPTVARSAKLIEAPPGASVAKKDRIIQTKKKATP